MIMRNIQPCHNVKPIGNVESLAKHLRVSTDHLIKVAENSEQHWRSGPDIPKPNGEVRHTHSASHELKDIHNRIKNTILRKTDYPYFLYGSLPKTIELGVRNHIANAQLHAGRRLLISIDIKGYFPSITATIVHRIWQGFYPFAPDVAEILTKLTTYKNQAPQGWSCSSYLAQLVFYDIEHEIVSHFHEKNILYSRLTDDITISTNQTLTKQEITAAIASLNTMLNRKGTNINRNKTRVDSPSKRQSVNKINVSVRGLKLSKEYLKNVRAKVHRITADPNSFGADLNREIQSVKGKISYIGKFHDKLAKNLKRQLNQFEQS